jgi:hypothetical protein
MSRGSGGIWHRLQYRHTVRTRISTSITIGPSLMGLRGTHWRALLSIPLSVAPKILPKLQIRVDSLIFKSLTWSFLRLLHIFKSSHWSFDLFSYDISQGVLMNKPDNSDGSRGQLTFGTDTCHLLQIQSPWTWIWETGQIHSFAAFRTYKEWIPVVLRVPSASTRIFLRVVDTDTCQQSASICVYWATQDGS